uniref:FYVE-type domain-containing protein n=1 Tax=Globisporangium ultimum (strain ATCC 200006 / CBS 805.95 / DAOM BR144) TaxID=431595 RepID=K3WF78_GLOUD
MLPPFSPTAAQRATYRAIAQELLNATLHDYDVFRHEHGRQLSRKHWKPVKTRENLTVYKERAPAPLQHCATTGPDWIDPKLLVTTGTIVGGLDDAMFGHVAIDGASMLLKAAVTKNRIVGGALITQIEGPSVVHPFRFLGVKWIALAPPTSFNGMIWSRDLVVVEATGVVKLPNGERIGYQLMKSIEIPEFGTLEHESIVRGRVCSCLLFRQLENRTVDIYLKGYVEAFGKVTDSLALKTCARGFLSSWNSVGCAQYKKILWRVQQKQQQQQMSPSERSRVCEGCSRKFGPFQHGEVCLLCDTTVCSRCRINWTLREVNHQELSLYESDAVICKSCITSASQQDPVEIAKHEIRSGRFTAPAADSPPVVKLWDFHAKGGAKSRKLLSSVAKSDVEKEDDDQHPVECVKTPVQHPLSHINTMMNSNSLSGYTLSTDSEAPLSFASMSLNEMDILARSLPHHHEFHMAPGTDDDFDADSIYDDDDGEVCLGQLVDYDTVDSKNFYNSDTKEQQQQQLWAQMVALQVANESIYQMTLQTGDAHTRNP